ncbi:MAG: hypothetical protein WCH99_09995 [Verrucomicrobiota bacterium]
MKVNTSETSTEAQGTTLPSELIATLPISIAGEPYLAKEVGKAKKKFTRSVDQLVTVVGRDFHLRLVITLSLIWLKIGGEDQYVDDVFAKLQEENKTKWVPTKSTMQHYEGPMLRWLAALARARNPDDPRLRDKFSPTFLRTHLEYIVGIGEKELNELQTECDTLVKLDAKYGNACLVANKSKPVQEKTFKPACKTKRSVTPTATQLKPDRGVPVSEDVVSDDEQYPPTNDELINQLHGVLKAIELMIQAGVTIERDARNLMFCCWDKANKASKDHQCSKN